MSTEIEIFNKTYCINNEKTLVYRYFDEIANYKSHGVEIILNNLKDSSDDKDALIYLVLSKADSDKSLKKEIKKLHKSRLRDIVLEMINHIDGYFFQTKYIFRLFFIGENYDDKHESIVYTDILEKDPKKWIEDKGLLRRELGILIEKFFFHNEEPLALEQYASEFQTEIIYHFVTFLIDGYDKKFIKRYIKLFKKYSSYSLKKIYSDLENLDEFIYDFLQELTMITDTILFILKRVDRRTLSFNKRVIDNKQKKEETSFLRQWEIDLLLGIRTPICGLIEKGLFEEGKEILKSLNKKEKEEYLYQAIFNNKKSLKFLLDNGVYSFKYEKEILIFFDELDKLKELYLEEILNKEFKSKVEILSLALIFNSSKVLEFLIKNGYDINVKFEYNESLLMYNLLQLDLDSIKKAISLGIDITERNDLGENILDYYKKINSLSSRGEYDEIIRYLDDKLKA